MVINNNLNATVKYNSNKAAFMKEVETKLKMSIKRNAVDITLIVRFRGLQECGW